MKQKLKTHTSCCDVTLNPITCLSAREALPNWDKQIQSLCFQANNIIEKIAAHVPDWMAKTMDETMTT